MPEYVSFSRLAYFASCPRKYFLKYIEKVPQPESVGLIGGKAIHKTSASGYSKMILGENISPNQLCEEAVFNFEQELEVARNTVGVEKEEEAAAEKDVVAVSQKKYATDIMLKKKPLEVESAFEMKFTTSGLLVKGAIDIIEAVKNKKCITEIKTSTKRQNLILYSPQVILYQKAKKIDTAKIEFILKKKDPEIQVANINSTEEDYQEMLWNVKSTSEILNSLEGKPKCYWYKNSGFWCGMCWYKNICYNIEKEK